MLNKNNLIYILLFILLLLPSCKKKGSGEISLKFGTERYDSTALHIAILTNKESLPILYAKRTGLFDSLGVHVQLAIYHSQIDCDTALFGKYADGGTTDLIRLENHARQKDKMQILWKGTDKRCLFTSGVLRLKDIPSLKGHTLAVSPRTADKHFALETLQSASIKETDIYWPQISSALLRANMLTGNQIDATILTWPYTSQALAMGHKCIYKQKKSDEKDVFVVKKSSIQKKDKANQWKIFEKARLMALDSIRTSHNRTTVSLILQKDYGLSNEVADTIHFPF